MTWLIRKPANELDSKSATPSLSGGYGRSCKESLLAASFVRGGAANKLSLLKYNNNGDFVTDMTFTTREHKESSAVVDKAGRVYALFEGEREVGFEVFAPQ